MPRVLVPLGGEDQIARDSRSEYGQWGEGDRVAGGVEVGHDAGE
ncbi:MAG: hypothetical protein AAGD25_25680 [Cyanobacteria bacterium P01_F01_bin.150]